MQVAAGTTEAASAHIATLIARIRLVNRQIKDAHQRLDTLTTRLIPTEEAGPAQKKQHDVEILASLPGGKDRARALLAEAFDVLQRRDYAALRSLTEVTRSPRGPAKAASSSEDRPATTGSPTPCITGRASPCNMTSQAGPNTPRSEVAVTVTAVPCGRLPTASSTSPAPC